MENYILVNLAYYWYEVCLYDSNPLNRWPEVDYQLAKIDSIHPY